MIYIYILCDPDTGKIRYVGQSTNPLRRFKDHLRKKEKTHKGNWIKSILDCKKIPIIFIIDEFSTNFEANYFENWYYEYFKFLGMDLTNNPSFLGNTRKMSNETKEKIRLAHVGKPLTPNHKIKIGIESKIRLSNPKNHGMFGKKQSESAMKSRVEKQRGIPRSKETKYKISQSKLGKNLSFDHKLLLSKVHSKKVFQYTLDGIFVKEYDSIKIASKETGISASQIGSCCRGISKTAKKFRWEFE